MKANYYKNYQITKEDTKRGREGQINCKTDRKQLAKWH